MVAIPNRGDCIRHVAAVVKDLIAAGAAQDDVIGALESGVRCEARMRVDASPQQSVPPIGTPCQRTPCKYPNCGCTQSSGGKMNTPAHQRAQAARQQKIGELAGFPIGARVRVNSTQPYGHQGRVGTVIGLPFAWGKGRGRNEWLKVRFDDNEKNPCRWYFGYFDRIEE